MKRTDKLKTEISRSISNAISQTFDINESGVFTIRNVDVLSDYTEVRIWISRIGGSEDFFTRLEKAKNRLKKMTFENITLVRVPQLIFIEDFTGEHAQKMEELMNSSKC
jgi:ribosome-binding factor A